MGEVYVAWDELLRKEVALKRLRAAKADRVDTLRKEVLLAQKVTHANVCRTYDLEILDGLPVIKMEYVEGETLDARLTRTGELSVPEALIIARQLAAGLAAAHAVGIAHRDVKPSNVLFESATGRALLMDFGIASAYDDRAHESPAGTPSYMAPEQTAGGLVDGRADLYALGCLLYRMLTGRPPFEAPTRVALLDGKSISWAPDGASLLYIGEGRGELRRLRLESGADELVLADEQISTAAESADGTLYFTEHRAQTRTTVIDNFGLCPPL